VLNETRRLPRVAKETLVVIAPHQPVTRSEGERIRAVSLGQATLDLLLATGMIPRPGAAGEWAGRLTLWVTTPSFLSQFGQKVLRELPAAEWGLRRGRGPMIRQRGRATQFLNWMGPALCHPIPETSQKPAVFALFDRWTA
jgi:hypothetical protein